MLAMFLLFNISPKTVSLNFTIWILFYFDFELLEKKKHNRLGFDVKILPWKLTPEVVSFQTFNT